MNHALKRICLHVCAKSADNMHIYAGLSTPLIFATQIVSSGKFLNPKIEDTGDLKRLNRLVWVWPRLKRRKNDFLMVRLLEITTVVSNFFDPAG